MSSRSHTRSSAFMLRFCRKRVFEDPYLELRQFAKIRRVIIIALCLYIFVPRDCSYNDVSYESWFVTIISILFIDRNKPIMMYTLIFILLFLTVITVIRALESRNQWRRMIDEGDVEIKDKISFD